MKKFPIGTFLIVVLTFITSITIAMKVQGLPWNTVPIIQLRYYGGIDHIQIANWELWRFFTAQLVHTKQGHMLFNVITLFLLGLAFERATSPLRFALLWLVSGSAGIYASIYFVAPPYDVGTGASQAVLGIAGGVIVTFMRGYKCPKWLKATLIVTIGVSLALDLIFAHYPKPGHVVGFIAGVILGFLLVPKANISLQKTE